MRRRRPRQRDDRRTPVDGPILLLPRRLVLAGAGATLIAAATPAAVPELATIEAELGGRVGVAALNTADGAWLRHRADERFAMCSSFKVLLAASVLARIDQGTLAPDRRVDYTRADLLDHSPRTQARVGQGFMSVADLCAAAVEVSDNGAANLLLGLTGGPAALTAWLRRIGDPTTRLDRTELSLNTNLPGDPRDTTTPQAFVATLDRLLLGRVLSAESRGRLADWMIKCETGRDRLRAGVPPTWRAGDKTGTGANGAVNDVAILWPPGRAPILIAVLMSGSTRPVADLNSAHARIARLVVSAFA